MTKETTNTITNSDKYSDNSEKQSSSIMVPIDDLDSISEENQDTVDELAMELATIQQSAKRIAIIG
ncbi:MAG: hypothetical protein WCG95_02675, partial [bacterium]